MPQLIRPGKVTVVSKEGEVELHVTIDLNINLSTGNVQLENIEKKQYNYQKEETKELEDDIKFEIPQFDSKEKVKFGIKKE